MLDIWWLSTYRSRPDPHAHREGLAVAKAKGRLGGKKPKLSSAREAHLVSLHRQGTHATAEIAELLGRRPLHRLPRDTASRGRLPATLDTSR